MSEDAGVLAVPSEAVPPAWLRSAVRDVLQGAPAFRALPDERRRALAQAMVRVSSVAAALIAEESLAQAEVRQAQAKARAAPLARAQEAPGFGAAADRVAGTTQAVLNAISFPRFVTDLVQGVFRAMLDSTAQQMQMYVDLLRNVSASVEGFAGSQFSLDAARQWLAERFSQFEYEPPDLEPGEEPDPDDPPQSRLRLRAGASMPDAETVRAALGLEPGEAVEAGNPEQLIPLARRQIARQRQQMLATMVMLGMQRIVIDSGRINASMRFHIDTRSVASEDRGSQFGMQNRVNASGSYGVGPWGAKAEVENTISYVSTQRSQNTEEINTDLELNSSVELNFRTDYLPLNQMAAQAQADRVRSASLNPDAAAPDPAAARQARLASQQASEGARRSAMDAAIAATPPPRPAPTTAPTAAPTTAPTTAPTRAPTTAPTTAPTRPPTPAPTAAPRRAA